MGKRHVFFSFHFDIDNWRASQVRNSETTQDSNRDLSFYDWAHWQELKMKSESAIKAWIEDQLTGFKRYYSVNNIRNS